MSGDIQQQVDTDSAEYKQGGEAGLNAGEDMKNWKAANEVGLELKESESSTPLFMSNSPEGDKGNAQDEKDESEE